MNRYWELVILDAMPPVDDMGGLAVGDIDGDGVAESVVGGRGALRWYRLGAEGADDPFESGTIAEGRQFVVGLAVEDVDLDGKLEVVAAEMDPNALTYYKPRDDLHQPWARHVIDPEPTEKAHDIIFADIDGDGRNEMIANAMNPNPGLFLYKPGDDPTAPWTRHTVITGIFTEGLSAGDLDGDGQLELVHGPDWFKAPADGPFSGPWECTTFAPAFREMCRTALVDITGNGRPDIVIAESEFMDGRMSWFENRLVEEPDSPWIEHPLDRGLVFAHSLGARRDGDTVRIFVAEMAEGGWSSPRNLDARLIEHTSNDNGRTWRREVMHCGAGTHQAAMLDADGSGLDVVAGKEWRRPKVQLFRQRETPSSLGNVQHYLIDRDKPATGTDILATDVNGDGALDVVCASWWYQSPGGPSAPWQRRAIPGVGQVIHAFDIDGDGRDELIATKGERLTSELCWLKPVDPAAGKWEEHPIGTGVGDWPHGSLVAPILPGGRLALVTAYHSANRGDEHYPEIFEIPDDPTQHPWPKRVLAEITYGEEIVASDMDGDGHLDLVAGTYWLESLADGTFRPHLLAEDFKVARVRVADINGDGRPDIIIGEEVLDFETKVTPLSRVAWLENPPDPRTDAWPLHVIDKVRCPHSIDVADLDGDGEPEVICGEHDPFRPYRSRCRLLAYKKAEPRGRAWIPHILDDRFEHHDGTKVFEVAPGRLGIISHGWKDVPYVHLWTLGD